MALGSIFLILALAVVVLLLIFMPMLEPSGPDELVAREDVQQRETLHSSLLAKRDQLLNALLELDADNELGKIPSGEYSPAREMMVQETADILRRLDAMNLSRNQNIKSTHPKSGEDNLEALIALRKKELSVIDDVSVDNSSAKLFGDVTAADEPQLFCTHCGKPLMPGDKFCPFCGKKTEP